MEAELTCLIRSELNMVAIKALTASFLLGVSALVPLTSAHTFDLHFRRFAVEQVDDKSGFAVNDAGRCTKQLGRSLLRQNKCGHWPKQTAFNQYMFTWASHLLGVRNATDDASVKNDHGNCSVTVYADLACKGEALSTITEISRSNTGKICHSTKKGKAARSARIECHPWPYINWSENEFTNYAELAAEDHEKYEDAAKDGASHADDELNDTHYDADPKFDGTEDNVGFLLDD
nr:hypothetical protein CFP56_78550 [Quercus suber]